jgi:hypothetical protein
MLKNELKNQFPNLADDETEEGGNEAQIKDKMSKL